MSNLRLINPQKKRHKDNAKDLLSETLIVIERSGMKVSGFVVMAWDDTGSTSLAYKPGGVVSEDAIATHMLSNFARIKRG